MKRIIFLGLLIIAVSITVWLNSEKAKPIETKVNCESKLSNSVETVLTVTKNTKEVDFSNFPESKTYYSRITEPVNKGSNFAGHYRLATWGCGTDCFGYVLIDLNSGEIISYEPANPSYHLRMNFDLNSRYFILDSLYAGEERRFYKIMSGENGKVKLELSCAEKAEQDYYVPPEELQ